MEATSGRLKRRHNGRHMGKTTGFKEFAREAASYRDAAARLLDFDEIYTPHDEGRLATQGARCMDCGVPFCQSGDGCPIDNLIPEWNDLVYRGRWREALDRLHKTNNFPEFTGRVCPAPCEGACVLGITDPPVAIKNIEMAIIDRGFAEGWVKAGRPAARTGMRVCIVGSGPAGLAAAAQLNSVGHRVTVYEREDRPGGLLMYGIPNMKLDKQTVLRRIELLREEGVVFVTGTELGGGEPADVGWLRKESDALLLATGATVPRDLPVEGRDLPGVHFAMEYLTESTRALLDGRAPALSAEGRDVIVIGGGDTGTDCIGTALRQSCRSLTNFELFPRPPPQRAPDNPWPAWPLIFRVDYGHEEGARKFGRDPRVYSISSKAFLAGGDGSLAGIRTVDVERRDGRFVEAPGTEREWKADLVLLSMGFLGPEHAVSDPLAIEYDRRSNYAAGSGGYMTSVPGVFAAGDCRRGQSLVVHAIHEGREAAREIDRYLTGSTRLP